MDVFILKARDDEKSDLSDADEPDAAAAKPTKESRFDFDFDTLIRRATLEQIEGI